MRTSITSKMHLLISCLAGLFLSVQITISGTVNFKNKGVNDISVTLKDTYDGTTTDTNGNFSSETSE